MSSSSSSSSPSSPFVGVYVSIMFINLLLALASSSLFLLPFSSNNFFVFAQSTLAVPSVTWPDNPTSPTSLYENQIISRFIIREIPPAFSGTLTIQNCQIDAIIFSPLVNLTSASSSSSSVFNESFSAIPSPSNITFRMGQRLLVQNCPAVSIRTESENFPSEGGGLAEVDVRVIFDCDHENNNNNNALSSSCGIEIRNNTFALQEQEQMTRRFPSDFGVVQFDRLVWSRNSFLRIINNTFSTKYFPPLLIQNGTIRSQERIEKDTTSHDDDDSHPLVLRNEKSAALIQFISYCERGLQSFEVRDNEVFSSIGALNLVSWNLPGPQRNINLVNLSGNHYVALEGRRYKDGFSVFDFEKCPKEGKTAGTIETEESYFDGVELIAVNDNYMRVEEPGSPHVGDDQGKHLLEFQYLSMSNVKMITTDRNRVFYLAYDDQYTRALALSGNLSYFQAFKIHISEQTYYKRSENVENILCRNNTISANRTHASYGISIRFYNVSNFGNFVAEGNFFVSNDTTLARVVYFVNLKCDGAKLLAFNNNTLVVMPIFEHSIFAFGVSRPPDRNYGSAVQLAMMWGRPSDDFYYDTGVLHTLSNVDLIQFNDNVFVGRGNGLGGLRSASFAPNFRNVKRIEFLRNKADAFLEKGYVTEKAEDKDASNAILLMMNGVQRNMGEIVFLDNRLNITADIAMQVMGIQLGSTVSVGSQRGEEGNHQASLPLEGATQTFVESIIISRNTILIRKTHSKFKEQVVSGIYVAAFVANAGILHHVDVSRNEMSILHEKRCPLTGCQCFQLGAYADNFTANEVKFRDNFCSVSAKGNAVAAAMVVSVGLEVVQPTNAEGLAAYSSNGFAFVKFTPVVFDKLGYFLVQNNTVSLENNDIKNLLQVGASGSLVVDSVVVRENYCRFLSPSPTTTEDSGLLIFGTPAAWGEQIISDVLIKVAFDVTNPSFLVLNKEIIIENALPYSSSPFLSSKSSSSDHHEEEDDDHLIDCGAVVLAFGMGAKMNEKESSIRISNLNCSSKFQRTDLPTTGVLANMFGAHLSSFFFFSGRWTSSFEKIIVENSSFVVRSYCSPIEFEVGSRYHPIPSVSNADGVVMFSQTDESQSTLLRELIVSRVSFEIRCPSDKINRNDASLISDTKFASFVQSSSSSSPVVSPFFRLVPNIRSLSVSNSNFTMTNNLFALSSLSSTQNENENTNDDHLVALQFTLGGLTHQLDPTTAANSIVNFTSSNFIFSSSSNTKSDSTSLIKEGSSTYILDANSLPSYLQQQNNAAAPSLFLLMNLNCLFWNYDPVFSNSDAAKFSSSEISDISVHPCRGYFPSHSRTLSPLESDSPEQSPSRNESSQSMTKSIEEAEPDALLDAGTIAAAAQTGLYSTLLSAQPSALLLTVQGIALLDLATCQIKKAKRENRIPGRRENETEKELLRDLDFPEIILPSVRIGENPHGASHRASVILYLVALAIAMLVAWYLGTINRKKWNEFTNSSKNGNSNKSKMKNKNNNNNNSSSAFDHAPLEKFFLKPIMFAITFAGPVCGILFVTHPSGAGDIVIALLPVLIVVVTYVYSMKLIFSFISEKQVLEDDTIGRRNQKFVSSAEENAGEIDEENTKTQKDPKHFIEESGIYFPSESSRLVSGHQQQQQKSSEFLSKLQNNIRYILTSRIGRFLFAGYKSWNVLKFDFKANAFQPKPGLTTQFFQLFVQYQGPEIIAKNKKLEKCNDHRGGGTSSKKNTVSKSFFDDSFDENSEEFLLQEEMLAVRRTRSRDSPRSTRNSKSNYHHEHRHSSHHYHQYRSPPLSPRRNNNTISNDLRHHSQPPVSSNSSSSIYQKQKHPQQEKSPSTKKSYDFSLKRKLMPCWFFISVIITCVIQILAGVGRADSATCHAAFIVVFVLTVISCFLFLWLTPYVISFMNFSSGAISVSSTIGGVVFLYIIVVVMSDSVTDNNNQKLLLEHKGWIQFAQIMCSFPGSIIGPMILVTKLLRICFMRLSQSHVVTMSTIRSRLITELDEVENNIFPRLIADLQQQQTQKQKHKK